MDSPPPRPAWIVDASAVAEEEGAYPSPFDAEKLSLGRNLGRALGTVRLGAWQERLPPGRRTSFTHAHSHEEELVYVIAGHPSVRAIEPGGVPAEHRLHPGDVVAFPAGTGIAHCFVNKDGDEAVLLVVGQRDPEDRVCYPDDGDAAFEAWHARERASRHWHDAPLHRKS